MGSFKIFYYHYSIFKPVLFLGYPSVRHKNRQKLRKITKTQMYALDIFNAMGSYKHIYLMDTGENLLGLFSQ